MKQSQKPRIIICSLDGEDYIELDGLILVDHSFVADLKEVAQDGE